MFNLRVSQFGLDDVQVQTVKVFITSLDISDQRPFAAVRHHAAFEAVIVVDRMEAFICQSIHLHLAGTGPIVCCQTRMVFDQDNEWGQEADAPA